MSNLKSAIDELRLAEPAHLPAEELAGSLIELTEQISALQAERLRRLRVFRARGLHELDGHTSAVAWLKDRCRLAGGEAAQLVHLARQLHEMPLTAAALADGVIGLPAVRLLARAASAHPEVFAEHEKTLVDAARSLSARGFTAAVAYWRQALDWDESLREEQAMFERRRLHVSETIGGLVRIDGDLDRESGEVVMTALRSIEDPQARSGDERTPPQRRADALVEICRSWLDGGRAPGSGVARPHLSVIVDLEALERRGPGRSETTRGTVLHPEAVRRLACDASVSRIVTDAESQPLDVGRTTRVIPAALRRALVVRDGGCIHEGCDRPPEWCDAHHIQHWADGGPTSLENLRLLCRRHHRIAHESEWEP